MTSQTSSPFYGNLKQRSKNVTEHPRHFTASENKDQKMLDNILTILRQLKTMEVRKSKWMAVLVHEGAYIYGGQLASMVEKGA